MSIERYKKINYQSLCLSGLVLVLLAYLGAYHFYFKAMLEDKKNILQQIVSINKELSEKRSILASYIDYSKKLEVFKCKLFLHEFKLVKGVDQAEQFLIAIINQQLPNTLKIKHFKLYTLKNTVIFSVLRAEIILVGNQAKINTFLDHLIATKGSFLLRKFKLERLNSVESDTNVKQKLSLLLDVYQARAFDFTNSISAQGQFDAVGTKNNAFNDKNYLKVYSIEQFKLVGFLQGGFFEKKWALVELPNTFLYKVEVGDVLGLEQAHILSFSNKGIIIQAIDDKKIELKLNN